MKCSQFLAPAGAAPIRRVRRSSDTTARLHLGAHLMRTLIRPMRWLIPRQPRVRVQPRYPTSEATFDTINDE
jgi:hypothetical protein